MAFPIASNRDGFRSGTVCAALIVTLALVGCGQEDTSGGGSAGEEPSGPGGVMTPMASVTPDPGGTEPQPQGTPGGTGAVVTPAGGEGGSGMMPSAEMSPSAGGSSGSPSQDSSQGGSGGEGSVLESAAGMGNTGELVPSGGGAGGSAPVEGGSGGDGAGGSDAASGGSAGSNGALAGECTRALLDGLLDDYFAALSAGDPSSLPLAVGGKFTENAEVAEIGTTDFWLNAGDVVYSQRALDTETCSVAAQAVIPEQGTELPVALRIKVEAGEMTEIETIVVRPGDYTASFAVPSNTGAIVAIAGEIGWHDEVPEGERATRQELTAWIDKYFRAFPSGVCNVTSACRRLENGGGDFSCGENCSAGEPADSTFEPRVIVVDEVRGIAAGLTIFDFMTTGHLDMHMIKMSGGQVHAVQAILGDTGGQSGWE